MHAQQTNHGKFPRGSRQLASLGMLLASFAATGCQVDIGGQTLPSPYYLSDDVQYFAPGPEFKLAEEAAQMKTMRTEQEGEEL